MSGRRTLFVIASALVAALGTALVWLYVQGVESRAQTAAQASVQLQSVLVVTGPAEAGTDASRLTTASTKVPLDLARNALAPGQALTGRLSVGVVPGTILRPSMLTDAIVTGVANGKQAASITIPSAQRVAALLKRGDDVAVYSYGDRDPTPRLELAHAIVRDVGPDLGAVGAPVATGAAAAGTVPQEIVTFEGKPADMLKILKITAAGRLAQLLINGDTATPVDG